MTFEEFKDFYEQRGFLPNDVGPRKNKLNKKQIKTRYRKYLEQEEKKRLANKRTFEKASRKGYTKKVDERWESLKEQLDLRECQLVDRIKSEENYQLLMEIMWNKGGHLLKIIDPAHVFSRAEAPHMKYDLDNVVPLNRFSHSMLDIMRDPITGESISKEVHDEYWEFIVGEEKYKELKERYRRR